MTLFTVHYSLFHSPAPEAEGQERQDDREEASFRLDARGFRHLQGKGRDADSLQGFSRRRKGGPLSDRHRQIREGRQDRRRRSRREKDLQGSNLHLLADELQELHLRAQPRRRRQRRAGRTEPRRQMDLLRRGGFKNRKRQLLEGHEELENRIRSRVRRIRLQRRRKIKRRRTEMNSGLPVFRTNPGVAVRKGY